MGIFRCINHLLEMSSTTNTERRRFLLIPPVALIFHETTRTLPRNDMLKSKNCVLLIITYQSQKRLFLVQLDLGNSNSVISNSPLFRTQNHFPWINLSVIYYRLFRIPAISHYFSFPLRVRNSGIQLYIWF